MDGSRLLAKRYRLVEYLGGSEADVYRGYDRQLQRPVAVKIGRAGSPGFEQERFENEMRTLAGLRHRALVTLYDAGIDDGNPYLVMQYVPGQTLADRIHEVRSLPEAEVRRIGLALVSAAAYLHGAGVVHRDIKPGNVLLSTDGEVYLADLGIARSTDSAGITKAGQLLGTPAYLAPEQVRTEDVGAPCDIYALGLVLLECFTGHREYRGSPVEAAVMRLSRPPLIPTGLPPEWGALLADMTEIDPAARPSATAVAARLVETATGASAVSRRRSPLGMRPSRLAPALTAAAAAAIAVAAGFTVAGHAGHRAPQPIAGPSVAAGGAQSPNGQRMAPLPGGMHTQPASAQSQVGPGHSTPATTDGGRPDTAGGPATTDAAGAPTTLGTSANSSSSNSDSPSSSPSSSSSASQQPKKPKKPKKPHPTNPHQNQNEQ